MKAEYSVIEFYNTSEDYSLLWDLLKNDIEIIYFYDLYEARKISNVSFVTKPLNVTYTSSILKKYKFGESFYVYFCSQGHYLLNLDKTDVTKFTELCEKYSVVFVLPKDLELQKLRNK